MIIHIHIYVYMTAWRIIWSSDRKLAWEGYELTITEFRSDALTYCLSGHEFNSNSDPFLYSYSNYIVCLVFDFISSIAFISRHFYFNLKFSWGNHMSVPEWSDTYGIHQWRIIWSSYRKLAWGGFEPTNTEFHSDALTYWAIRPWVQLQLRSNFLQLLQLHRLFSVQFHFGYCLHQLPHLF